MILNPSMYQQDQAWWCYWQPTDSSMSSYFCDAATPMPLRCRDDIHSSVRMLRGAPSKILLPTCRVTVFSSSCSRALLLLPMAARPLHYQDTGNSLLAPFQFLLQPCLYLPLQNMRGKL